MTNENDILSEADEMAAMLPWYVSGKISDYDKALVDAYRREHPEFEAQIVLAREEADVVFADNAAITVPRDALGRLRQSVAASPRARLYKARLSIAEQIGLWLQSLTPRQLAYGAIAAALVVLVQAASISSGLFPQVPGNGGYQTASGSDSATGKGTFALVALQPGVPAGTLSAFLADEGYQIIDGPKAGGVYRLRLADVEKSDKDLDQLIVALKARSDLFSFVSAASQTP